MRGRCEIVRRGRRGGVPLLAQQQLFPSHERGWQERERERERERELLSLLFFYVKYFIYLIMYLFIYFLSIKKYLLIILISINSKKIYENINFLVEINLCNKIHDKMHSQRFSSK